MSSWGRVVLLMALCVAAGAAAGVHWASGRPDDDENRWPENAPVARDIARPTLVLFVHPGAPETPSVLRELERLQARMSGRLAVSVRFYRPNGPVAGWDRLASWRRARVAFSDVAADPEGGQAKLFEASPSGTAVMYAPSGRLLFRGEVLSGPGRSSARANPSLTALLRAWHQLERSPVIGSEVL